MSLTNSARARRWTVSDGFVIAGWEYGEPQTNMGRPLAILHHANGMCAATWTPVAARLEEHFHVFALDARGHGDSTHGTVPDDYAWSRFVDDLIDVTSQILGETAQTNVALGIGSSFGGIITAAAQAEHGELFQRIVMLDPPIHPTAELARGLGLDVEIQGGDQREQLVTQTLRRRAVWPDREAARAAWRDKPLFAPWTEDGFDLYLQEGMLDLADGQVALKCDPSVEAHIFATTGSLAVEDYAPRVDVPLCLVHAQQGYFPKDFFHAVAGLFPQGEFAQLSGGHLLPLECPEQVADYLLDVARGS